FWKSREREQIHAYVLQRTQGFRGFTGPVRHLHVKVVDRTNRVCHSAPPGACQRLTILPRSDGHARAAEAAAARDATKKQHQLRGRACHYSAAICSSAAGTPGTTSRFRHSDK